jgi:hypothetical protein
MWLDLRVSGLGAVGDLFKRHNEISNFIKREKFIQ